MARRSTFGKDAKRPKDIDLILPGLGVRNDRFRVSSQTYERKVYEARVAMVRDLASRLLFPVLRACIEGRVSITELYLAYSKGETALAALVDEKRGQLLQPLLDAFLLEARAKGKDKYRAQIDRFLTSLGGPSVATSEMVTTEAVSRFLATLRDGKRSDGRLVSESTRNRYRSALGSFFTWLMARGYLSKHPIAFKAVRKYTEPDPRMPNFGAGDYAAYFATLAEIWAIDPWFSGPRADLLPDFSLFYRLLIHTGADVGEVMTRRVDDLFILGKSPRVRYRRTKTHTPERIVPMPGFLADELAAHIERRKLAPRSPLFGHVAQNDLATAHEKVRAKIGQDELRLKDFRHVAAISWRRNGTDLLKVRDWLGHASITQTMIYAAYGPDKDEDAAEAERAAAWFIPALLPQVASGPAKSETRETRYSVAVPSLIPGPGLEPGLLTERDFKSLASTRFAIPAE